MLSTNILYVPRTKYTTYIENSFDICDCNVSDVFIRPN